MKLSKTTWLILTIGFFIIAFASLGIVRSQQVQEQDQLNQELTQAQLRLNEFQLEQLSSQHEELEKQLSQTISQFEAARTMLSQPIGSITTSGLLFDIAAACGVEVTEISSSGLASDDLEGVTCSVLPLSARVEGDVSDLVSFITNLYGELTNGIVKSVEISIPETTSEEKPSANIQLVIYTYQGD